MTLDELASIIDGEGHPAPRADQAEAFELLLGAKLPDDYRTFLTMTPGGIVRATVAFSLVGEELGPEELGRVAGLGPVKEASLRERFLNASDYGTPAGLLSIMTDVGGNDIALSVRPDRFGEVFFLDHEAYDYNGRPSLEDAEHEDWAYATSFASSFSEIVARFKRVRE